MRSSPPARWDQPHGGSDELVEHRLGVVLGLEQASDIAELGGERHERQGVRAAPRQ